MGLFYNRFRHYDPIAAQYVAPDSIGIDGGIRTFSYTTCPLSQIDPLGKASQYFHGLSLFDGKTTHGLLVIPGHIPTRVFSGVNGGPEGEALKDPNIRGGAVAPLHAEGHAAMLMRKNNAKCGVLYINHPGGVCNFCRTAVNNMLPKGAIMDVYDPGGGPCKISGTLR